jgi:hypothetical protein
MKSQKRKDWEKDYDYIEWEEFKNNYFKCDRCGYYTNEQCICYAR